MPKYLIERQFLLPVTQRLIVEAADLESACQQAIEADDWVGQEEIHDAASTPTINGAREIDETMETKIKAGGISPGAYLWKDAPGRPPLLEISERYLTKPD